VALMRKSLDVFFRPESVAVIGASPKREKLGYAVIENLIRMGYPGKIYPVNPNYPEIQGLKAYPSVKELPEPADVGVILVPAEASVEVLKELVERGVMHVVIVTGGFGELDEKGLKMQQEIVEISKKTGVRIIGPNTTGIVSTPGRFSTTFTRGYIRPGSVAYVAQTGIFGGLVSSLISTREYFGISRIIGLGNKVDVDDADALEYLENDSETKVIIMHIEGLKDGRRFMEVASRVSRKKPILALKSGRTPAGAKASYSHTASLAANDAIVDAAFKQAGVIRVNDYMELVNYAKVFAFQKPPRGNHVGVLSISGGLGVMTADACEKVGLEIVRFSDETTRRLREASPPIIEIGNPYDIWPSISTVGVNTAYKIGIDAMMKDQNVEAILAGFGPAEGLELENPSLISDASKKNPDKPIVAYATGDWHLVERTREALEKLSIPVYYSPEDAAQALTIMYQYSRIKSG